MINTKEVDGELFYQINYFNYSSEKRVPKKTVLKVLDDYRGQVDLTSYTGLMIVDKFYCKNCNKEIAEGVLVIKEVADDVSQAGKNAIQNRLKREYKIKGDMLLLTEKELRGFKNLLKKNTIHPVN